MITVSLCMIVKNEERILRRCLDSIADLMDEIIIVDTGSTDATKKIAAEYTDKVYDFEWIHDFAAARNFAFSKAGMEYIYSADADEVLDAKNRRKFLELKKVLLPEIDIVQMKYSNQLQFGTIYNFDEEYRPKLFKRIRTFRWTEAIHETVLTEPVVYESEITIIHLPEDLHAGRDFSAFLRLIQNGEKLSKRLQNLYAKELFISGKDADFQAAFSYFAASTQDTGRDMDEVKDACCVAARAALIQGDKEQFFKYALKAVALEGCSEICCELGNYYMKAGDFEEAAIWFYNARYETEPILNIKCGFNIPLEGLITCYKKAGNMELAQTYQEELDNTYNSGRGEFSNL